MGLAVDYEAILLIHKTLEPRYEARLAWRYALQNQIYRMSKNSFDAPLIVGMREVRCLHYRRYTFVNQRHNRYQMKVAK